MISDATLHDLEVLFLIYFALLNGGYVLLNLLALGNLIGYMREHFDLSLSPVHSGFEPPVTLIVPAHNEAATITATVRSLLQLTYPEFEVLVVNDGSTDGTLDVLRREFSLTPFPEAYRKRLPTEPVRGFYTSEHHPRLRVIDKAQGGKADALNAGINAARYPLYCSVDADSILQRDSLQRVVMPFVEDPRTVATGGTVRIVNGCTVRDGFIESVDLPKAWLGRLQVIEYLRAYLFGRLGWSPLNALLIISGAFGVFHKETVVEAGGYRRDTVGEDMELVVRLHRHCRTRGRPYRIRFVPDPICWTEAPEHLRDLQRQRIRWQRGLGEALTMNLGLMFHPRGGAVGWLAFPFMFFFEWLGAFLEVGGYAFVILLYFLDRLSLEAAGAFFALAVGLGMLLSVTALLLEESSFHLYPKARHAFILTLCALLENFGYRQLNALWRSMGNIAFLLRCCRRNAWRSPNRSGQWHAEEESSAPVLEKAVEKPERERA